MPAMLFDSTVTFLQDHLPVMLVGTVLFFLLRFLLLRSGQIARHSLPHEAALILFALYLTTLLSITFLPFRFAPEAGSFVLHSTMLDIFKGEYIAGSWVWSMIVGNVLMLIPFGFLAPLLWNKLRGWRVLPVGLAFILTIELFQPLIGRSFDLDDILLNFLGTAIGALLSAAVQAFLPKAVTALRG